MPERDGSPVNHEGARPAFIDNEALREIRANTDWRRLFAVLGLVRDEKKSKEHDWWALSPLGQETDASFHVNDKGWYDFGRGLGGGPIELVQAVLKARGEVLNCYEAGSWLVEHGVSPAPQGRGAATPKKPETVADPAETAPERPRPSLGPAIRFLRSLVFKDNSPTGPASLSGAVVTSEPGPSSAVAEPESCSASVEVQPAEEVRGDRGEGKESSVDLAAPPSGADSGGPPMGSPRAKKPPPLRPLSLDDEDTDPTLENPPIRQNLLPLLTLQGEHPEFVRRGISKETCEYLGCGFLEQSRSPLTGRIVFQIRGLRVRRNDSLCPVILSHIGRATTPDQVERDGKWHVYAGFNKSRELYNLDCAVLDDASEEQIRAGGQVLLVEGPFDVAKLVEAGIKNVVASLGSQLSPRQGELLVFMLRRLRMSAPRVLVFYDRDEAGQEGGAKAVELLQGLGVAAEAFGWEQTFASARRPLIRIPDTVKDPGDLSVEQLRWLRIHHVI